MDKGTRSLAPLASVLLLSAAMASPEAEAQDTYRVVTVTPETLRAVCVVEPEGLSSDKLGDITKQFGLDLGAALVPPTPEQLKAEQDAEIREAAMDRWKAIRGADIQSDSEDLPSLAINADAKIDAIGTAPLADLTGPYEDQRAEIAGQAGGLNFITGQLNQVLDGSGKPLAVTVDPQITAEDMVQKAVIDVFGGLRTEHGIVCSGSAAVYVVGNSAWPVNEEAVGLRPIVESTSGKKTYSNAVLGVAESKAKEEAERTVREAADKKAYADALVKAKADAKNGVAACTDAFDCGKQFEKELKALQTQFYQVRLRMQGLDGYYAQYTDPNDPGYPGYVAPPEPPAAEVPDPVEKPRGFLAKFFGGRGKKDQ